MLNALAGLVSLPFKTLKASVMLILWLPILVGIYYGSKSLATEPGTLGVVATGVYWLVTAILAPIAWIIAQIAL